VSGVKQMGDGLEGSRGGRVVWTCGDQLLAVTGFDRSCVYRPDNPQPLTFTVAPAFT